MLSLGLDIGGDLSTHSGQPKLEVQTELKFSNDWWQLSISDLNISIRNWRMFDVLSLGGHGPSPKIFDIISIRRSSLLIINIIINIIITL